MHVYPSSLRNVWTIVIARVERDFIVFIMLSQNEAEDVKPKLNLVVNCEGHNITVKVKPNMPFKKIFEAAEKRFGKDPGTFRFSYEGNRVRAEDTPAQLGMEEGDTVDAHLQQVGGSGDVRCRV